MPIIDRFSALRTIPGLFIVLATIIGALDPKLISFDQRHWIVIGFFSIFGVLAVGATLATGHQEVTTDTGRLGEREFLQLYTEALSSYMDALPALNDFTRDQLERYKRSILVHICAIAEACNADGVHHKHQFNACWYDVIEREHLTNEQIAQADKFGDSGRLAYHRFLVLKIWAFDGSEPLPGSLGNNVRRPKPCVDIGFTLPVDESEEYVLFGAPEALLLKHTTVIENVKNEHYLKERSGMLHAPKETRKHILSWMSQRESYSSFASIPISVIDQYVGVLCLQSKQKTFCDLNDQDTNNMIRLFNPFVAMFGQIVLHSTNKKDDSV